MAQSQNKSSPPSPRRKKKRAKKCEPNTAITRPVQTLSSSQKEATRLTQARTHWLFNEWAQLTQMQLKDVEHQPQRDQLALLIASAYQQQHKLAEAKTWACQALAWGASREAVTRVLVSGVHSALGRVALLQNNGEETTRHFGEAVQVMQMQDTHTRTLVKARIAHETRTLQGKPPSQPSSLNEEDGFYRAFEDKFRGSRESIKERVAVYVPFVQPVAERYPHLSALDLGCGRGEWLEVLQQAGITAEGVDQNSGMLQACKELGLSVQQGDLVTFLQQLPDQSRVCISLIHVVEHLPFDTLRMVVKEAKRVLVPEGILIMETPNPENILVGSCNFYMDPTHRNPLPPPLLAFVTEYYGFERSKILRLQEEPALHNKQNYEIKDYLGGISPDYTVLAQKKIPLSKDTLEEQHWGREYGFDIQDIILKL
ncbi:class I SAM-dependent methyltransferase [Oceanimonas pelagia]|uniref:Class I SAM-dependent methyltransferase n=1 Tax=Oceanimonas pelagia TaxID=3028314 RepID=A0AA50QAL5_9GAMM|nr:class I SAM-dependent methyltransferase [Oceanimonas pelagia]WMC09219.1 class I SAM-dependent methyltransferase [Oceanimonas pelagia]